MKNRFFILVVHIFTPLFSVIPSLLLGQGNVCNHALYHFDRDVISSAHVVVDFDWVIVGATVLYDNKPTIIIKQLHRDMPGVPVWSFIFSGEVYYSVRSLDFISQTSEGIFLAFTAKFWGNGGPGRVGLALLDAQGNPQWIRYVDVGHSVVSVTSVAETIDGYTVAGIVDSLGGKFPFIAMIDQSGFLENCYIEYSMPGATIISIESFPDGYMLAINDSFGGRILRITNSGFPVWILDEYLDPITAMSWSPLHEELAVTTEPTYQTPWHCMHMVSINDGAFSTKCIYLTSDAELRGIGPTDDGFVIAGNHDNNLLYIYTDEFLNELGRCIVDRGWSIVGDDIAYHQLETVFVVGRETNESEQLLLVVFDRDIPMGIFEPERVLESNGVEYSIDGRELGSYGPLFKISIIDSKKVLSSQ